MICIQRLFRNRHTGYELPIRRHSAYINATHKVFNQIFFAILLSLMNMVGNGQDKFIGLTSDGGALNAGTAFSILLNDTNVSIHHNFMDIGYGPGGDLIRAPNGFLYGTTPSPYGGKIFKVSSTGRMAIIKKFDNVSGGNPKNGLTLGPDGNLYGMTYSDYGTIYRVTPSGNFSVIKAFNSATGVRPVGKLTLGKDGNFYGMTSSGGAFTYYGTIFKVTAAGELTVLKSFDQYNTGSVPYGSLVQDEDSTFYGMTSEGGNNYNGTIFKIKLDGTFSVLYNFKYSYDSIGRKPLGSLVKGTDGQFYGMTSQGGIYNAGALYKISSNGVCSPVKMLDLDSTGGYPNGSLVLGNDGSFYGTASYGGKYGAGTIFKCSPSGSLQVLRHLNNLTDGGAPAGTLYKDTDGYYYGTTSQGGTQNEGINPGGGTLFKISPSGSFSVVFRFRDNTQGMYPSNSLVQGKDGLYYGMAPHGGKYGYGTIYRLCTDGSFTALHSFNRSSTGAWPSGNLIQAKDGNFYGMTPNGGKRDGGTIFRMTPSGAVTILKHFNPDSSIYSPKGSLVEGKDGNLYGFGSSGYANPIIFFKITTTGTFQSWSYPNYNLYGYETLGSLVQGKDGNFYGTASKGGLNRNGTIFKITPEGAITLLWTFGNWTEGNNPSGDLVEGKDGNFYGMTTFGGKNGAGLVFQITPSGAFTIVKHLQQASTGMEPYGGLIQASNGGFYGLTKGGGRYGRGTFFRVTSTGYLKIYHNFDYHTEGGSPTGSLIIQKPNPIANPQSISTAGNTTKKIKLSASGGTPITFFIATAPKNGTVTINKDTLLYTPKAGYAGTDSLYVTATWGCQKSVPAKIKVTVNATALFTQMTGANVSNEDIVKESNGILALVTPNPTANTFNVQIRSRSSLPVHVKVTDALGRLITNKNITSNSSIDVGREYKPGIYFMEVMQGRGKKTIKLMKVSN